MAEKEPRHSDRKIKRTIKSAHTPDSFTEEAAHETMTAIHIRPIRGARGGIKWEIISFINRKGIRIREVRKTKEGALKRAFSTFTRKHEKILVHTLEGNEIAETIDLRKKP